MRQTAIESRRLAFVTNPWRAMRTLTHEAVTHLQAKQLKGDETNRDSGHFNASQSAANQGNLFDFPYLTNN
jgi:hypothetical protein